MIKFKNSLVDVRKVKGNWNSRWAQKLDVHDDAYQWLILLCGHSAGSGHCLHSGSDATYCFTYTLVIADNKLMAMKIVYEDFPLLYLIGNQPIGK